MSDARTRNTLQTVLEHRLSRYALIAGAMLFTASAEGALIAYPPNTPIANPGTLPIAISNSDGLDLNQDGTADFTFILDQSGNLGSYAQGLAIAGVGTNAIGMVSGEVNADRFPLSSSSNYAPITGEFGGTGGGNAILARVVSSSGIFFQGEFGGVNTTTEGYILLRFDPGTAQTHYGWARLSVTTNSSGLPGSAISATLLGFGWEDQAGQAVHLGSNVPPPEVPEPSSLGLLAAGAIGLAAWRRRKAAVR